MSIDLLDPNRNFCASGAVRELVCLNASRRCAGKDKENDDALVSLLMMTFGFDNVRLWKRAASAVFVIAARLSL